MSEAGFGAGDHVADRYRLVERLGAGGMGVVWAARDDKLARKVAVKLLPPHRVGDLEARERMLREARAAARLDHAGVVQVFDVGETPEGGVFIVMELVRGRSLRDLIVETLPLDERLRILRELATVLDAAHEAGLVHRDIKPDNAMVRDDGRVALLDFGLARAVETELGDTMRPDDVAQITVTGAVMGTPAYLSPEQARGNAGPASDRWAIGVVAYELLTGRLPWAGTDPTHLLAQILTEDAKPASEVADLPAAVDEVFRRALSRDVDARFESSVDLVDALGVALEGATERPELANTVPLETPVREAPLVDRSRANPLWPTASALASIAGVAAAALLWSGPTEPPAPVDPPALLSAPDSTLACPMLESDEPWLGYAAAALVCERARWRMGGLQERVRPPAVLLDLPRGVDETLPSEPWDEERTTRALEVAARRSEVVASGRIERVAGELEVRLRLSAGGAELATASGRARGLLGAVRQAMAKLDEHIPLARSVPDEIADATGLADPVLLVASLDSSLLVLDPSEPSSAVREDVALTRLAESGSTSFSAVMARFLVGGELALPDIDDTSPGRLAQTGWGATLAGSSEQERLALITSLGDARAEHPAAPTEASLLAIEAHLMLQQGESERSHQLMARARSIDPYRERHWSWAQGVGRPGHDDALYTAGLWWVPHSSLMWVSRGRASADVELRLEHLRRGYVIAHDPTMFALPYGDALLESGAVHAARALAGELDEADPLQRDTAVLLYARAEAAEVQLGAAWALVTAWFRDGERPLDGAASNYLFSLLRQLAVLLGRRDAAAQLVHEHVVSRGGSGWTLTHAASTCALAPGAAGSACLEEIERTFESEERAEAFVGSLVSYHRGEYHEAARALRRRASGVGAWRTRFAIVLADVFDRAGEPELAAQIDARALMNEGDFNGANLAHYRAARRARARGDHDEARRLAQRCIEAWAGADPPVVLMPELREIASAD